MKELAMMMDRLTGAGAISQKKSGKSFDDIERERARWLNEVYGSLDKSDGINCDKCRNKGFIAHYTPEKGQYDVICGCMKIRRSVRLMRESGLEGSIKKFSEFQTSEDWQKSIKSAAMNFASEASGGGARCFYIGGQSGAGKTHICTAIAREFLINGKPVRYIVWVQEIERLKAFDNEQRFKQADEDCSVDVLYIDDFFKPCGGGYSPSEIRKTFELIDRRYKQPDKITIISGELDLKAVSGIDEAIAGRIYEMAGRGRYVLKVPRGVEFNFRSKAAARTLERRDSCAGSKGKAQDSEERSYSLEKWHEMYDGADLEDLKFEEG